MNKAEILRRIDMAELEALTWYKIDIDRSLRIVNETIVWAREQRQLLETQHPPIEAIPAK